MKVSKLVVMISAALSVSAHAMTIEQANANVARAEQAYAKAVQAYKSDTYENGSSVAQGHYDTLNAVGEMRAAAYADQRAAVAQHQSESDAADKAQAIKERNQAITDSNNAGMSHRPATQWSMTPGIVKESNPAGKPTGQVNPMDPGHWTQQPGVVKESNPAGHPTNQIAPATHLDATEHHAMEPGAHLDGQHSEPAHVTSTARPDNDRSSHLDAPAGIDRSSHLDGQHSEPAHVISTARPNIDRSSHLDAPAGIDRSQHLDAALHVEHATTTATPNIDRATHLDSSITDQQAATAAKAAAEAQHKAAIANYGVKGNPNLVSQYSEPKQVTYSGATVRPGYTAVNVAASSLPHDANVTVATPEGTKTVAVSTLKPDTQVSVPMNPVFSRSTFGNNGHDSANAHGSHDGGRGGDNAHSEAFGGHGYGHDNSASEGFGGHSQFH